METITFTGNQVTDRNDNRDQSKFRYLELRKGLLYYSYSSRNMLITSPNEPTDPNKEYLDFGKNEKYEIIASVNIPMQPEVEIQIASADDTERNSLDTEGWETVVSGKDHSHALEHLIQEMNSENISIDNNWLRIKQGGIIATL